MNGIELGRQIPFSRTCRLNNVKVKNLEVSDFHEAFDVGLGLHACGIFDLAYLMV